MMISLDGVLDLHVHTGPDVRPRKTGALELARAAESAGMRGFVLKNHHTSTVQIAAAVSECVPAVEVYGGIALNHAVGGLNPEAVDAALRMGGRIVWMPTQDAAHQYAYHGRTGGLSVFDDDGALRPEIHEIIALIREHEAVLAFGHVSHREMLALAAAGRDAGLRRMLVNHPEIKFLDLSLEQQRALAGAGVYFERCYIRSYQFTGTWEDVAAAFRELGPKANVLGTDLGQPDSPDPVSGMEEMLRTLHELGVPERDLDVAARELPRELLRI